MKWLKGLFTPATGPSSGGDTAQRPPGDAATHTVVLRLDPQEMAEPDLDVRSEIEKMLRDVDPALPFFDDGYGFAKTSDAMLLVYATSEPERFVDALKRIVEEELVGGNRLAPASVIGIAVRGPVAVGQEFKDVRIVYPPAEVGKPLAD